MNLLRYSSGDSMSVVKASKEGQVNSPECMNPKNAKQKAAKASVGRR